MVTILNAGTSSGGGSPSKEYFINNIDDLKSYAASYAATRAGVLQSAFTIDERIDIATAGFFLKDVPPKAHKLTLTADGYFNILNGATDWNEKSWTFQDLNIDGNNVATRCITTENGTVAKRTYQPTVNNCRLLGFGAANAIVLNLKDVETGYFEKNLIYGASATGTLVHIYNTGVRNIGHCHFNNNEILPYVAAAAGGVGIWLDATGGATGGGNGNLFLNNNHYIGLATLDSVALRITADATVKLDTVVSSGEKFETCRMLQTDGDLTFGQIKNINLALFTHTSPGVAAQTTPMINLTAAVSRAFIAHGNSASSGSDNVGTVFCHNDGAGTNQDYNAMHDCYFGWVKTVGANKSYLVNDGAMRVKNCYGSDGAITDLP